MMTTLGIHFHAALAGMRDAQTETKSQTDSHHAHCLITSRKPQLATGSASSQSPPCGAVEAKNLANCEGSVVSYCYCFILYYINNWPIAVLSLFITKVGLYSRRIIN